MPQKSSFTSRRKSEITKKFLVLTLQQKQTQLYRQPSTLSHNLRSILSHLSYRRTNFSIPCRYQSLLRVIIQRVITVSTSRSFLNLFPPIFLFSDRKQMIMCNDIITIQCVINYDITCHENLFPCRQLYLVSLQQREGKNPVTMLTRPMMVPHVPKHVAVRMCVTAFRASDIPV